MTEMAASNAFGEMDETIFEELLRELDPISSKDKEEKLS